MGYGGTSNAEVDYNVSDSSSDDDGLSGEEVTLLTGALGLTELTARQAMAPDSVVSRALMFSEDTTITADIIRQIATAGHSRIPIYRSRREHIIGYLHARFLLPLIHSPPTAGVTFASLGQVSATMRCSADDLLIDLYDTLFARGSRAALFVVHDNASGDALGILTRADLLARLHGAPLRDEAAVEADELARAMVVSRRDGRASAAPQRPASHMPPSSPTSNARGSAAFPRVTSFSSRRAGASSLAGGAGAGTGGSSRMTTSAPLSHCLKLPSIHSSPAVNLSSTYTAVNIPSADVAAARVVGYGSASAAATPRVSARGNGRSYSSAAAPPRSARGSSSRNSSGGAASRLTTMGGATGYTGAASAKVHRPKGSGIDSLFINNATAAGTATATTPTAAARSSPTVPPLAAAPTPAAIGGSSSSSHGGAGGSRSQSSVRTGSGNGAAGAAVAAAGVTSEEGRACSDDYVSRTASNEAVGGKVN
jgi:hypothetical protein